MFESFPLLLKQKHYSHLLEIIGLVLVLLCYVGCSGQVTSDPPLTPTPTIIPTQSPSAHVLNVKSIDYKSIEITFDTALDPASAENPQAYTMGQGLSVNTANLDPSDTKRVLLSVNKNMWPKVTSLALGSILSVDGQELGEALQFFTPKAKIAFVSQAQGLGDLSTWSGAGGNTGIQAAHAICQSEASAAGFVGDFAAWISDANHHAIDSFLGDTGAYLSPRADRHAVIKDLNEFLAYRRLLTSHFYYADGSGYSTSSPASNSFAVGFLTATDVSTGQKKAGAETCSNWTSSTAAFTGYVFNDSDLRPMFPANGYNFSCTSSNLNNTVLGARLWCMQKGHAHSQPSDKDTSGQRMFVTSVKGPGDLTSWSQAGGAASGLEAADNICKNLAAAAALNDAHRFKAWLSSSIVQANTRFTGHSKLYYVSDGIKVADSFQALGQQRHFNAMDYDETGTLQSSPQVWTNFFSNGGTISQVL